MTETISFAVTGMTCISCVNRITRSLRKVEGVHRVKIDLGSETATVERDSSVPDAAIAAAVRAAGYEPDMTAVAIIEPLRRPGWLSRLVGGSSRDLDHPRNMGRH